MRPGQAAPVFQDRGVMAKRHSWASMRPGQAAPVFGVRRVGGMVVRESFNEAGAGCPGIHHADVVEIAAELASMRPGQAAPVFPPLWVRMLATFSSFNEAGAGCPGIPCVTTARWIFRCGFNEAGAGCPGIRGVMKRETGNMTASMRPGQAAPVFRFILKYCAA